MGVTMANKIYIIMLLLLIPAASAYQQGYLVFDSPGWDVELQYTNAQQFSKDDMLLDVRATSSQLINPEEFAQSIGGTLESENQINGVTSFIISNSQNVYIFGRREYEDHTYTLTFRAPANQKNLLISEANSVYNSISFSQNPSVVEADWEKELVPPKKLSFFEANPMPWDYIILILVIAGIGYLIYNKKFKKSKKSKKK